MAEHDADREESYQEEPEEKKFPVFIVPLIAGPVLLLVLIVAMHVENQKEKDKSLNEAYDICAKAMDNFGRIDRYYEENKLRPRAGHKFEWEDGYQQASQLQYDIQKAMGM
jgi:hypothetical protein